LRDSKSADAIGAQLDKLPHKIPIKANFSVTDFRYGLAARTGMQRCIVRPASVAGQKAE